MDVDADTHTKYAHNGKVLLGSATLLFFIFILIIFLHTYANSCHRRHPLRRRRHNRYFFPTASIDAHRGLDPSLFNFLPTFTYSSATHRHLQECAVCLSEFEEDEEGRLLPNCNHGFHALCIDTWFRSHSNCPICRGPVRPPKIATPKTEACVSNGEFAGCSYLPPPIACRRKELDLDMVNVIVEAGKEESGERMRTSESGSPGEIRLKSSDEPILIWKGIGR